MIGPMSQRLGQSLTEHNASLQALHGRVEALATGTQASFESLASGTQAALATSVSVDDGAVAAIEPRLASLASDLAALRSEVSALAAASPTAALVELKDEIAKLAAKPAGKGSGSARAVASADVDAAVAAAESRIKDHVDDAIVALAQTLLGKARADAVGAVAPVDEPAAAPARAVKAQPAPAETSPFAAPTEYADDGYDDDQGGDADDAEGAAIDLSAPALADQAASPIVAWSPQPVAPTNDAPFVGRAAPQSVDPFDQDADWDAHGGPHGADDTDAAPEGRRRWFSW
jgi:hypothetical protein